MVSVPLSTRLYNSVYNTEIGEMRLYDSKKLEMNDERERHHDSSSMTHQFTDDIPVVKLFVLLY